MIDKQLGEFLCKPAVILEDVPEDWVIPHRNVVGKQRANEFELLWELAATAATAKKAFDKSEQGFQVIVGSGWDQSYLFSLDGDRNHGDRKVFLILFYLALDVLKELEFHLLAVGYDSAG